MWSSFWRRVYRAQLPFQKDPRRVWVLKLRWFMDTRSHKMIQAKILPFELWPPKKRWLKTHWRLMMILFCQSASLICSIGFRWLMRNVSAQHAEIWMGFDDCDGWRFDPRATTVAWRVGASPFSKMTTCTTIQRSAAARRWKVTQTIPARIRATDVWGSCRELVHPRGCSITRLEEKNRFQGLRDESPVDSPSCEALRNTMQMGACLQGLKLGKYLSVRLFVCVDKMKECTIYLSIYLNLIYLSIYLCIYIYIYQIVNHELFRNISLLDRPKEFTWWFQCLFPCRARLVKTTWFDVIAMVTNCKPGHWK